MNVLENILAVRHHNVTQTMETRGENENSNGLQNNAQILTRSPC